MLNVNVHNKATFDRLFRRLNLIRDIGNKAGPLMEHWERIIEADNREGVLAGTDKYGSYMLAVTYRPKKPGVKLTVAQRLGQHPRQRRGDSYGIGSHMSGVNNNLTSSEYRRLDGPPLAPRRQFSRVITNLVTASWQDNNNPNQWYATGAWDEVVSAKGVHFLPFHFDGEGRLPVRDLRGVRPEGKAKARESLRAWALLTIREFLETA